MASYRLEWRRSTRKDLRRIAAHDVRQILSAAESLAEDPFPPGCVKLSGSERSYRIRVGNYRILYEVQAAHLIIEVVKVGHRRGCLSMKRTRGTGGGEGQGAIIKEAGASPDLNSIPSGEAGYFIHRGPADAGEQRTRNKEPSTRNNCPPTSALPDLISSTAAELPIP